MLNDGNVISHKNEVSNIRVSESLSRILNGNILCSISTMTPDGKPYINTCFYSFTNDLKLYVFTSPKSAHAINVENNSACSVNIFSSLQKIGDDLLGGQLFATMKQLDIVKGLVAFRNYTERFPILLTWANSWDAILKGFQSRFYEITILSGKILDEGAFGKEEYVEFDIKQK